jgi:hypothetical protein
MAGGYTDNSQRLYTSEYYAFDPFVDFDKFVNFSQYYWLPAGPDDVDVYSGQYPLSGSFDVTRENGVYTFGSSPEENPTITLVRGGSYQFNVAQNAKETVNYRVSNDSTSAYLIDYERNPTLTLVRGNTYVFTLNIKGDYPFYIKTQLSLGTTEQYTTGVTNNGATTGKITFVVPQDAPDTLYYTNDIQRNMQGTINIVDGTSGTGPGFWIQTEPGIDGKISATPNISSRDVLGVVNNGEDLVYSTELFFKANNILLSNFSFYVYFNNLTSLTKVDNSFNFLSNQQIVLTQLSLIIKKHKPTFAEISFVINYFLNFIYLEIFKYNFKLDYEVKKSVLPVLKNISSNDILSKQEKKKLNQSFNSKLVILLEILKRFGIKKTVGLMIK